MLGAKIDRATIAQHRQNKKDALDSLHDAHDYLIQLLKNIDEDPKYLLNNHPK